MYMLYVIVFTVELGLGIVSPLLPDIMMDFSLAAWQTGLMVTVYGLARLMADLPMAFLLDRVNRTSALALGALLVMAGSAGCAFADSYEMLLLARLVMGIGTALCMVTALFTVSKRAGAHSRGRSIGIYQATLLAGVTISPALGGAAASIAGWRAAFLFAAFAGLVALLMVLMASRRGLLEMSNPPGQPQAATSQADAPAAGLRVPWNLIAINFTTFVFFASTSGFRNSMVPVYGGTSLGMSAGTLGLLLGGSALIRFAVTLGSGIASDRWGRKIILIPGTILLAAGTLGFALVTDEVGFAVCLVILSLGGFGNSVPTTMLVDAVSERRVGRVISINRAVGDLGLLVGPVGLGLVLDLAGFPTVALLTAAVLMSTVPGIAISVREKRWAGRRAGDAGTG